MYKKILTISIIFLLVFSCSANAALPESIPTYDTENELVIKNYKDNDTVTFIVEVDGDPVLAGEEAALFGSDYANTDKALVKENKILDFHYKVMNNIKEGVASDIEPLSTYTLLFNGFAVKASYSSMDEIKNIPGVKNVYISENIKIKPYLSTSVGITSSLPSQVEDYSGKGQAVAVIDTEFNVNHDFFKTAPLNPKYSLDDIKNIISSQNLKSSVVADEVYVNEKIPFAYDYANKSYDVYSTVNVHGSHVAGIIGGKNGKDASGNTINGVAPDCQLLLMKVTDKNGEIIETAVLDALEDAVKLGASVVNVSLGIDYASSSSLPVWEQSFNNAYNAGVFVCAATGNLGRGFYEKTPLTTNIDYSAAGVPATFSNITAVASATNVTSTPSQISSFSSYGVTENLELKPEITAPGQSVYSSVPNNSYTTQQGTSMASPHIAGAAIVLNEYLDDINTDITGKDRINLIENLLMSTAVVLEKTSSGVPYSPRVQGAGMVNTSAAIKTPCVLTGARVVNSELIAQGYTKTKISLGDGLESIFDIAFTAKNLTGDTVSYDKISVNVLTDGYKLSGGKYYVSDSVSLNVISHTLPNTITLGAYEEKVVTAQIKLDENTLKEFLDVYKNGFFVDGFVRLEKTDASIPSIGIPFTGFYGDWTKANVFDTTLYDIGGSYLNSPQNNVGSTLLYTKTGSSVRVLGNDGSGNFNSDYIALSPNGDGNCEEILIQLTPMRTLKDFNALITDKNGSRQYLRASADFTLNKFYTASFGIGDISHLEDGDYILNMNALYNFEKTNPTDHILKIPFYVDTQAPEIITAITDDDLVSVTFRDNKHVAYVYTYYQDQSGNINFDKKYVTNSKEGEEVTVSFDLSDINASSAKYEDIYIFVHDMAENYYVNSLSSLTGYSHPVIKDFLYSSGIFGVTFDIESYISSPKCTMLLAFYDNNGSLIYLKEKNNVTLPTGKSTHTFTDIADLTGAYSCKLFIWNNMKDINPIDTSKSFYVRNEIAK